MMQPIQKKTQRRRLGLTLLRALCAVVALGLVVAAGTAVVRAQTSVTAATPRDPNGRYTFSELADQVLPSVVTVYVKANMKTEMEEQRKKMDEFRKRFNDPGLRQMIPPEMMPFLFPDGESPFDDPGAEVDPSRPDLYGLDDQFIPTSSGSGIVISDDGYILTNHHVVTQGLEEAQKVIDPVKTRLTVAFHDGSEVSAEQVKIVYSNPVADLALLKVEKTGLKPIKWGNSDSLRIGEAIAAVGSPLDLKETITDGIIGAKGRSILGMNDLIQTSAVINPGSSGGPLVNLDGEMVGVNRLISSNTGRWQGYGFAIPSNDAKWFVDEVLKKGRVEFGYLGIQMWRESPEKMRMMATLGIKLDTEGVLVQSVTPDSPADKAGLRVGDFITKLDDEEVKDSDELLNIVKRQKPGVRINLTYMRENEEMKLETKTASVTLTTRPDESKLYADLSGVKPPETKQPEDEKITPKKNDFESLGLTIEPVNEGGVKGLRITAVESGSAAARVGLKAGDVITQFNRQAVSSIRDAERAIEMRPDNRAHSIQFLRDGREQITPLEPAEEPIATK